MFAWSYIVMFSVPIPYPIPSDIFICCAHAIDVEEVDQLVSGIAKKWMDCTRYVLVAC